MVTEGIMWKLIFTLATVAVSSNLSCEGIRSMENKDTLAPTPTPTPMVTSRNAESNSEAEHHYREALNLRAAGKTADSIEEFKKAIESGNDDKETYREIARMLSSLKRYEEAEVYFRSVLKKDSGDAMAHWALTGILVEHLGKYEDGLKEAFISEKLYGKDGLSYVRQLMIGKAYDGLGEYENAVKYYKLFLKGSSYTPDADDYKGTKKRISELEKIVETKK